MRDGKHVVEANHARRVMLFSAEPIPEDVIVVTDDPFNPDIDSPQTDEQVTIAQGTQVVRGKIVQLVYLVAVAE